ncbi:MAG: inositol monophosphatase family protein [Desulfobulbaceae bacterium]|nr:inositol monophosphatase family protein [Desulfobulbaceae bacterium]
MNRLTNTLKAAPSRELQTLLVAAARAALTAGTIIRELYAKPHTIRMKGEIDLVTEADLAAETAIIASLDEDAPGIAVMAEESYQGLTDKDERTWIIDPLDGTTNFAHGIPIFAVSIGLLDLGKPLAGVTYCPLQDELFCTTRGGGAWLNDRRIQVTQTEFLVQALVATGFPYDIRKHLDQVIGQTRSVLPKVRDIRRMGAAAVDLAYVACGRLDGFWETGLKPWDTTAGWLLVEEAGGTVTDFNGQQYSPFKGEILASNTTLHPLLIAAVA